MTPTPTPAPHLPKVLADPHKDILPHRYVVHVRRQICTHCQSMHEYSELYAKTHMRSQWGHKYVTNLRPLDQPKYDLPIEVVNLEIQKVPLCHECVSQTMLSHLPTPPVPDAPPLRLATTAGGATTKSGKNTSSINDLLKDIL